MTTPSDAAIEAARLQLLGRTLSDRALTAALTAAYAIDFPAHDAQIREEERARILGVLAPDIERLAAAHGRAVEALVRSASEGGEGS